MEENIYRHVIAVTNRKLCREPFLERIEAICRLHPRAILLREKDLTEEAYEALGKQVFAICHAYQVECIFHTYTEAAIRAGVKSIHYPIGKLRELDRKSKAYFSVIGCSIHSLEEALEAEQAGASYATAGHIFQTDCKKGLPPKGLEFLKEVCKAVSIPVYAIGGIHVDQEQIQQVLDCRAAGVCMMSDMMTGGKA